MNNASVFGQERARFFHLYCKSFISEIILTCYQTQLAVLRKEMRNTGGQGHRESDQVNEGYFNDDVGHPASGCAAIIGTAKIAFQI